MVSQIRIYIEGVGDGDETETRAEPSPERLRDGDESGTRVEALPGFRSRIRSGKETKAGLRPGFRFFLKEVYDIANSKGIEIRLILCGSRRDAYEDFKNALEFYPDAFNVLLVDSEEPVSDTPWEHLRKRRQDQWDSMGLDDNHCHFMVQTMEAWFIADVDALKEFYGEKFKEDKIHRGMQMYENVEKVSVKTLDVWLRAATRETEKGKYHKAIHAPKLLELLDVAKVRNASPNCDRLFTNLAQLMEESATS